MFSMLCVIWTFKDGGKFSKPLLKIDSITFESVMVTKLPDMPTPMVPPRVLANWWEAVATPRSDWSRLSCTTSRVAIETNPIPTPTNPKTIEQADKDVPVENVIIIPPPTARHREPKTVEGLAESV